MNLYLITREGQRHEDHIPYGVLTFSEFKKRFPSPVTETEFILNTWKKVYYLNIYDHIFSSKDIEELTSSHKAFDTFINNIGHNYDGEYYCCNVIQIVVNEEMDST